MKEKVRVAISLCVCAHVTLTFAVHAAALPCSRAFFLAIAFPRIAAPARAYACACTCSFFCCGDRKAQKDVCVVSICVRPSPVFNLCSCHQGPLRSPVLLRTAHVHARTCMVSFHSARLGCIAHNTCHLCCLATPHTRTSSAPPPPAPVRTDSIPVMAAPVLAPSLPKGETTFKFTPYAGGVGTQHPLS